MLVTDLISGWLVLTFLIPMLNFSVVRVKGSSALDFGTLKKLEQGMQVTF
jgi:hypothetical protein